MDKVKRYTGVYSRDSQKKRFQGNPDKCFYITYQDKSKKVVWEKVGWTSEGYSAQVASNTRGERIQQVRHGKLVNRPNVREMTLADAWKHYDKWLDTGKKYPYDDRNRYDKHIKPKFADKALSQITTHDLEKFKATLLTNGLAPQTVKHILVIVRQVFNKMITWKKWEGINPIRGLKMPKIHNRRERFLTYEEAQKLIDEMEKTSRQLWEMSLISLHTGMRANEIFSLLWGHIDFDNDLIHVADPKGGPPRKAMMTKKVNSVLDNKKKGEPGTLVFKSRDDAKIKAVSKAFGGVVKKLGFNDGIEDRRQIVSFHTLRHTFASWLAIQGTPILEIKELLGHATLAMTERYAHLIPDKKRESVNRMERIFDETINHHNNPKCEPGTTLSSDPSQ